MAKIVQGYSPLRRDYDKHMKRVKIAILVAILCFFLTSWKGIFFLIMLGIIVYSIYEYSQAKQYITGVTGERKMLAVSAKLPSTYTVVTNVEIHHEGKSILYDAIIVGPSGIYVIEVKNMNGRVIGAASQFELVQEKIGRGGGSYSKSVRNPVKAVGSQVHLLSTLLKHHNLGVWISGMVFFTNKDVRVNIVGSSVPIFTWSDKGAKRLKAFLAEAETKNQAISEQAQQKAVAVLTGQAS